MASRRLPAASLLAGTLLSAGCGTIANYAVVRNEEKVYGGVRFDIACVERLIDGDSKAKPLTEPGSQAGGWVALVILAAPFVDIPLSFVGDTLTYPLARRLDKRRLARTAEAARK